MASAAITSKVLSHPQLLFAQLWGFFALIQLLGLGFTLG